MQPRTRVYYKVGSAFTGEDGLLHNEVLPYPSPAEVERADRLQLGRWYRFLSSPGLSAIGIVEHEQYVVLADLEKVILNRIIERFISMGGWDYTLSKEIGWTL